MGEIPQSDALLERLQPSLVVGNDRHEVGMTFRHDSHRGFNPLGDRLEVPANRLALLTYAGIHVGTQSCELRLYAWKPLIVLRPAIVVFREPIIDPCESMIDCTEPVDHRSVQIDNRAVQFLRASSRLHPTIVSAHAGRVPGARSV